LLRSPRHGELCFGAASLGSINTTYPFASQADVLVNARHAADAVGARRGSA